MMSFKYTKPVLFVLTIIYGFLLFFSLPKVIFNNDYWLPKENPYQQQLNYLETEFQPGFGAIIVLDFKESYFKESNIKLLRSLTDSIESLDYVFKVNSPLDATVLLNYDGALSSQTYDEAILSDQISSISDYRSLFLSSPYYGKLLSQDEHIVGISISIDKKNDNQDNYRRVITVEALQKLVSDLPDSVTGFLSGDAAIYYEMDEATYRHLMLLLPLAFCLLILTIRFFLGQWKSVGVVVIPTLVNLGFVPIILVLLGHYITIINVTLFILVLVITVADGIHMLNYWQYYRKRNHPHPINATLRSTWLPCFITSITTAVGFGSFVTSSIIPLHQYGIQAFFVMIFAYLCVMTLVPILIKLVPPDLRVERYKSFFSGIYTATHYLIVKFPKFVSILAILITLFMAQSLWYATTETSFMSVFFKDDHEVRQNVDFVDQHLLGSGRLDVILNTGSSDGFKSLDNYQKLSDISATFLTHDLVNGVTDMTLPVRLIHSKLQTEDTIDPQTADALEQELLFLEFSRGETKTDVLSSVVDFNYQHSRIELITDQLPTKKINELVTYLDQVLQGWDAGEYIITGSQFLSYILGQYVLQSQFITVLITLSFIWVLFVFLFGFRLGTIGMVPNFIPMIFTMSLLPMTNTPFDFATVLISSVTLGLCVDDTIHWLHYYQQSLNDGVELSELKTNEMMIKPLLITTIVLGLGFGVLGLANLVILQKFGIFTFIAIFLAWLADIVILPAILQVLYKKKSLS